MPKKKIKVAFQGEKGAYSEEAAFLFFGGKITTIPCKTFADVFMIAESKRADFSIVPIENSLEGSVGQNYDLLLRSELKIFGEMILRIRHCFIASKRTKIKDVKKVYSHPQALGQCREFLERLKIDMIPFYDTAGAAKMIKEEKLNNVAAVASKRAAAEYGLSVLKKNIETNFNNYTRFFVISKKESEKGKNKTSIVFSTKHIPGALAKILKVFADYNINLTKIESRPILERPWEYNFYLDFEGRQTEKTMKELRKYTTFLKVIGFYPKAK